MPAEMLSEVLVQIVLENCYGVRISPNHVSVSRQTESESNAHPICIESIADRTITPLSNDQ